MASDIHDPSSGASHPDRNRSESPNSDPLDITGSAADRGPMGQQFGSSSGDDLAALLEESKPDPFLDEFPAPKPPVPKTTLPAVGISAGSFDAVGALDAFTDPMPVEPLVPSHPAPPRQETSNEVTFPAGSPLDSSSSELIDPLASLGVSTGSGPGVQAASFDAFPTMDLNAPPSREEAADDEEDEDDDGEDLPPRRSSMAFMLLLSYASAVTIGLIWVLLSNRRLRETEEDPFPTAAAETRADPGIRASGSRKMGVPPALPADHMTSLGTSIRLGDLDVTPLEITSGNVKLSRSFGEAGAREGGGGALMLKLRLKNASKDSIFAPLDEGFLRERGRGTNDSLIATSDGQQIDMYPLAVTSEMAIVGQEFRELKPGESYETRVVSAPGSVDRASAEMTWRVRLRTGLEKTDTLGVRFKKDEIKPAP